METYPDPAKKTDLFFVKESHSFKVKKGDSQDAIKQQNAKEGKKKLTDDLILFSVSEQQKNQKEWKDDRYFLGKEGQDKTPERKKIESERFSLKEPIKRENGKKDEQRIE